MPIADGPDRTNAATPAEPSERLGAKLLVSGFAVLVLAVKLVGRADVDAAALGLVALAVLPWLSTLLDTAELPGGWKVKFREVRMQQERLVREVEWLKFLMRNFLTRYELEHLQKFAAEGPFWFEYGSGTTSYFERELRRMLDLNLIERLAERGVRTLLYDPEGVVQRDGKQMKDVKQHLRITEQGRDYLAMRDQLTARASVS